MRTEDVPAEIRARVANANGFRAQVGNSAGGWRSLSEIKSLTASMFGAASKPRRAKPKVSNTTTEDELYRRTFGSLTP